MPMNIPDEGEVVALSILMGKTATENLRLRLFTNNFTPSESNTTANFTEATGSGYGNVLLTAANWVVTSGNPSHADYPEVTFAFTGALGNVYGYYLTGETSGKVRFAERFSDGPYVIEGTGDQIRVTPVFTLADVADA